MDVERRVVCTGRSLSSEKLCSFPTAQVDCSKFHCTILSEIPETNPLLSQQYYIDIHNCFF